MAVIWSNGRWIEEADFSLPAADRGVILGFALFETMLAVDGRPKFVEAHLKRWRESCARLGWEFPGIDLEAIGTELLAKNGLTQGRGRLRMTMTAGSGSIFNKSRTQDAVTWIVATPVDDPPENIAVTISQWKRNAESALAGLKTAAYADNILALDQARAAGFGEAIFLNTAGQLCEAATSNVFIVRNKRVLTPSLDSGCLPGVMRSVIIGLARKSGLDCLETPLERIDLENADEIFLTSAIRGPVPVSRLDRRAFAATPVTDSIRSAWREEICHG